MVERENQYSAARQSTTELEIYEKITFGFRVVVFVRQKLPKGGHVGTSEKRVVALDVATARMPLTWWV